MSPEQTIRSMMAKKCPRERAGQTAADEMSALARKAARVAWVGETMTALRAAQRKADEAWAQSVRGTGEQEPGMRLLAPFPDDADDEELKALPPPPEQAELDAIHAELKAVIDHDRWPKHLYWTL